MEKIKLKYKYMKCNCQYQKLKELMGDKGIVHNRNCPLAVDKKYIKDKKDDKSQ